MSNSNVQRSSGHAVSQPTFNADADALTTAPTQSPHPAPSTQITIDESLTPYGVTREQLEALSAMAFLVGSPLQRQQPTDCDPTHPALLVAAKLLQQGVDPERVIQLVECRYGSLSTD